MPLPTDEKVLALSNEIIQVLDTIFGLHPGFRPVHAKGILLTGTFTPTSEAAAISRAPHLNRESTPVTVRFSDNTGIPLIPDNDPNTQPRGFAIRFHLADRVHTDIIAHSTNGFPSRTGQDFLEFLRALAASSDSSQPHPWPIEAYLGAHPAALAFVQAPKPAPVSFATESFFGLTAVQFANKEGATRYARYRIIPDAGNNHLDDATAATKGPNYLFDELPERLAKGPIKFEILAQLANDGDIVDDVTIHWPDERPLLHLGTVSLTALVPNDAHEQQFLIFDPIPRVDGIDASADPLLELRAAVYLITGRRRRAATTA
jgi:catalase